ncbi:MAG: class I poly(R)-hydroxyalkanoic acid synthase [Pseudomonadota bacterium]
MTDDQTLEKLNENLAKVDELSQRLMAIMQSRPGHNPALDAPDPALYFEAAQSYWKEAMANPAKLIEQQMGFWSKTMVHFAQAQSALAQGKLEAPPDPGPSDKRFGNPLWDTHPYFNFVKQQYMINADAMREAVENAQDLEPREKRRLSYFSDQIIDMMSPTNFLASNPDALEKAMATEGQSLVDGLENLIADLEANSGEMVVRLVDDNAFEVGGNIATTPGKVVLRNRMMELIQYEPVTEQVYAMPLMIFPPWINKYYILDLKEQNSMIKWLTEQGYTVFVISWINPGPEYADIGMEEYIEDGYVTAIREVKEITGQKKVNVVGYCIAGTTLALTLSLLKQRGDTSINSATFFTALTDFSEQGEFTPFLQNDFIDGIEKECADKGMLPSVIMARTFSFLRSNDLIYRPAIKSYMMGETPPAFDLLYWNGDGANLPAKMAMQYLRGLCQRNELAAGGFDLLGHHLVLDEVDIPLFAVTCETDHIAAWKDCYRGVQKMGAKNKTFVLSESGHIAGIVNPPSKKKYGHYTNPDLAQSAQDWKAQAEYHKSSWWPTWHIWLKKRSGKKVAARVPGDKGREILCDAPGTYVLKRATE